MRELSLAELSLVSGGYGECEGSEEECDIIVTGHYPPTTPPTGPSWPPFPPTTNPPVTPPYTGGGGGQIQFGGDPCAVSRVEANEAIDNLRKSPTAAAIVNAAMAANLQVLLNRDHNDSYNSNAKYINWDPYSASSGTNSNGTIWTESPTLGLIHEMIHWQQPNLSHAGVNALVNTIARELNQYTGTNYAANRGGADDSRIGGAFLVNDTDSTVFDIGTRRPTCGTGGTGGTGPNIPNSD